jgi:TonB dependent receptor/Carboxypeptidase regulatory-like domain/TonB-dependent Receptor Plug Domain
MNKYFKFTIFALSLVLSFSAIAFGQGTSGSIEGTVKDTNGAAVPGITVTATSTGSTTGYKATTISDADGSFSFQRVLPGTYRVATTKDKGFGATTVDNVSVSTETASNVEITIKPGVDESIDITSTDSAQIDATESKLNTTISAATADALPKGVTFGSLLKTAPNVRAEPLAAGFQIDGASGAENVFIVDGQEVTNFRTGQLNSNNNLPFDVIQEVQIKSTGFEAEYGGATGGVINVVTAGGNNKIRGSAGISFTTSALQGSPNSALLRFSNENLLFPTNNTRDGFEYFKINKTGGTDYFPVARISGPIVKDKLWFSAVYAPQILDRTQEIPFFTDRTTDILGRLVPNSDPALRSLNTTQQFVFKRKTEEAFVRLDAQPSSKFRLFGTFLWNPIVDSGALPGFTYGLSNFTSAGPISGSLIDQNTLLNNQGGRQNSNSVNGQATWTPTSNLVLNVRAGRSFLNEKLGSYGIPNVTRFLCSTSGNPASIPGGAAAAGCSRGFSNVPSNFEVAFDVSTRKTLDADLSLVGINFLGSHNFKVGYQYNGLSNTTDQGYPKTGIVTLFYGLAIDSVLGTTPTTGNLGSGFITRFSTKGKASSTSNGLFVQDQWQIGKRVTFNLGVRAEKEDVPSFNPNNPGIKFNFGDKIAPRFGVAVDLTGDGKTKLFGSYGWFYDRFKYELPRGSFGGDFFRRDYFEILPGRGSNFNNYSLPAILGTVTDIPGGRCPDPVDPNAPYPTLGNGFSICQLDFRIPSNSGSGIEVGGAVDPNIKAARQSEYTFGVERQLFRNLSMAGRYTHKQVDHAIEDIGIPTPSGSEAYVIGNPGEGLAASTLKRFGYTTIAKAQRDYDALEIRLDKRLSNNYFFNASYTYSRLFGNYSGLASSDEAGRSSPNVNRFFDLPFLGFTADGKPDNGRLATDRPHVFKAYGGYSFGWNKSHHTDISSFTTFTSGTPLTTQYTFYSATAILKNRGDLGRTAKFTETDLLISHKYKFGNDNRITLEPFLNILNLFDERNELTRQTVLSLTNFTANTLRTGGCATCPANNEVAAIQRVFNGGIQSFVTNFISGNRFSYPGGVQTPAPAANARFASEFNNFNKTNSFQLPREVRFGFRVFF